MGQEGATIRLEGSVGYALKQAQAALRTAMDAALRPLGLTVPQYSCLELLGQRPGLSNAELARGAFVTRQSMNLVLRGLQSRGLLARPGAAEHGRARPSTLTPDGATLLATASAAVHDVEARMLAGLDTDTCARLHDELAACARALGTG